MEKDERQFILVLVAASICATFLFGHLFALINGTNTAYLGTVWSKWDAENYIHIAQYGYSTAANDFYRIAFMPGYPALIAFLSSLLHDYVQSGLLISNAAYAATIFLFYKLMRLDFGKDESKKAIVLLSVFPTAFFLHAPYTESVFLALSVASFYCGRKGHWLWAGLLGMAAASIRLFGIVLLLGLAVEYLSQKKWKISQVGPDAAFLLLVPLGLLPYVLVNASVFGDPLAFVNIQSFHFLKAPATPISGLVGTFLVFMGNNPNLVACAGLEIAFAFLAYLFAAAAAMRLRPSYGAYCLGIVILFTSTSLWNSNARYMLSAFPLFSTMAIIDRNNRRFVMFVAACLILQACLLWRYIAGQWAF